VGATVVARGDAPIFQAREHNLDFVGLAIKDGVVVDSDFTLGFRGDFGI
jgi:hypothetical protein